MAKWNWHAGCPQPCKPVPPVCILYTDPGGADGTSPVAPFLLESGSWQYQSNRIIITAGSAGYVNVDSAPSVADYVTCLVAFDNVGDSFRLYVRRPFPADSYLYISATRDATNCGNVELGVRTAGVDTVLAHGYTTLDGLSLITMSLCYADTGMLIGNCNTSQVAIGAADPGGGYSGFTGGPAGFENFQCGILDQSYAPECPACPIVEPVGCINGTGPGNNLNTFNCRYSVLAGSAPDSIGGFPSSAKQHADGDFLMLSSNVRGATSYQRSIVNLYLREAGQKARLYVCDDGTLTTGAWGEVECTLAIDPTYRYTWRVGVGGTQLLENVVLSNFSLGVQLDVCHDGQTINVPSFIDYFYQLGAGTQSANLQAQGFASGNYCGLKFSGITYPPSLDWYDHTYSRLAAGAVDPTCGSCNICTINDHEVPCLMRIDLAGWTGSTSASIACDEYNGQWRVWGVASQSFLWYWSGGYALPTTPGPGSFGVAYNLALGENIGSDTGWYAYVWHGPTVGDLLGTADEWAFYKLSLGGSLPDLFSWNNLSIPLNPDYVGDYSGGCTPGTCNVTANA